MYEVVLYVALISLCSLILGQCTSKKAAPSVAPIKMEKHAESLTATPVSKSPAPVSKSLALEKDEDVEKKKEKGEEKEEEEKGEKKKEDKEEKKDDSKEDKKDEDHEKKKTAEEKENNEKKDENKNKNKDERKDEKKDEKKDDEKDERNDEKKEEKKDDQKDDKKAKSMISVDAPELIFERTITSQKKLLLKNLTAKKVMFKIKCSSVNVYFINPVFGKIDPMSTAEVTITHRPSEKQEDKLVIVPAKMKGKEIEMAQAFKQIKKTGSALTVKLVSS